MPSIDNEQLNEQSQTLMRAASLIGLVFVIGVIGYMVISGGQASLVDAIYMTLITLTTVGYGEVIDLSNNPAGRVFTSLLLVVGVGSFVYFFSNFTAFLVEGNLDRYLWRRRMRKVLDGIENHYIVCGGGRIGVNMIKELIATERRFVLIEREEAVARELSKQLGFMIPTVVGDATDDDVLDLAHIGLAIGLAACCNNDKDNLLITISAKMLRPELRVVARCVDDRIQQKLRKAGANSIVSPNLIGGLRMVSELIRPDAVTFLDTMLRDPEERLRVEDLAIKADSKARGKTIDELRHAPGGKLLIVAVMPPDDGKWDFAPSDELKLELGMKLVFMGSPASRKAFQERWG